MALNPCTFLLKPSFVKPPDCYKRRHTHLLPLQLMPRPRLMLSGQSVDDSDYTDEVFLMDLSLKAPACPTIISERAIRMPSFR